MNKVLTEKIVVGNTASGQEITIDKFTVDSGKAGKTVFVQGGIHGGEVTLPIFRELFDFAKENLCAGKIIFVPFCNKMAWAQVCYAYTVGKFSLVSGTDFNRVFDKDVKCLSDKNMEILGEIIKKSDFYLDLHTARTSTPFGVICDKKMLRYAKIANLPLTQLLDNPSKYKGCSIDFAAKHNVPALVIECGCHDDVNDQNTQTAVHAVLSILVELGVLSYKTKRTNESFYFTNQVTLTAPIAGIAVFKKSVGETVKKGEVLFQIMPPDLTARVYDCVAEFDGTVLEIRKTHIFNQFDVVMDVIKSKEII